MATGKKISALPALPSVLGTLLIPVVDTNLSDNLADEKMTVSQLMAWITTQLPPPDLSLYAKLDGTNQPFTGDLTIQTTDDNDKPFLNLYNDGAGGKRFSIGSTNDTSCEGAGLLSIYSATDGGWPMLLDSTGNVRFGGVLTAVGVESAQFLNLTNQNTVLTNVNAKPIIIGDTSTSLSGSMTDMALPTMFRSDVDFGPNTLTLNGLSITDWPTAGSAGTVDGQIQIRNGGGFGVGAVPATINPTTGNLVVIGSGTFAELIGSASDLPISSASMISGTHIVATNRGGGVPALAANGPYRLIIDAILGAPGSGQGWKVDASGHLSPDSTSFQLLATGGATFGTNATDSALTLQFNQPTPTTNNLILRNYGTGGQARQQLSIASDGGFGIGNGLVLVAYAGGSGLVDYEGRTMNIGPVSASLTISPIGDLIVTGGLQIIGDTVSLLNLQTSSGASGTLWCAGPGTPIMMSS